MVQLHFHHLNVVVTFQFDVVCEYVAAHFHVWSRADVHGVHKRRCSNCFSAATLIPAPAKH